MWLSTEELVTWPYVIYVCINVWLCLLWSRPCGIFVWVKMWLSYLSVMEMELFPFQGNKYTESCKKYILFSLDISLLYWKLKKKVFRISYGKNKILCGLFSRCSTFLPQSKHMQFRWIGVRGCESVYPSAIDWIDRLHHPVTLNRRSNKEHGWMLRIFALFS